jgi:hypothetical protein
MIVGLPLLSVIATIISSPSFIAIIVVVDLMFIAVVAALVT